MLRRNGIGQTSNRNPVASQGLPALLAAAITPPGTAQEGYSDPRSDPPNEHGQSALGCTKHPRRTAQTRSSVLAAGVCQPVPRAQDDCVRLTEARPKKPPHHPQRGHSAKVDRFEGIYAHAPSLIRGSLTCDERQDARPIHSSSTDSRAAVARKIVASTTWRRPRSRRDLRIRHGHAKFLKLGLNRCQNLTCLRPAPRLVRS